jgi:hypothetical protein
MRVREHSGLLRPPIFIASSPDPTLHPRKYAPLEHLALDDELVYPVEDGLPRPRFTRALAGLKSLSFEDLLAGAYLEALADSQGSEGPFETLAGPGPAGPAVVSPR